jgi:hypothetical protein
MEAEKLIVTKEVLVVEKLVDVVALTTCNTVPALLLKAMCLYLSATSACNCCLY